MKISQCTRIYLTLFMLLTSITTEVWAGCIKPKDNSPDFQLLGTLFSYADRPSTSLINDLKTFVNSGGDINRALSKTVLGRYAWLITVGSGHANIVDFLLENGANPNETVMCKGLSPLIMIVSCMPSQKKHVDIFNSLVKSGAKVNKRGPFKRTPLFYAVGKGNDVMTRALIESGADVNATTLPRKLSPLRLAVERGYASIVSILLENGALMSDADKCKLLSLASKKKYSAVINVLNTY